MDKEKFVNFKVLFGFFSFEKHYGNNYLIILLAKHFIDKCKFMKVIFI